MNSRLTILTGKWLYLENETHRADPTYKNTRMAAYAAYTSSYTIAMAIPVCQTWADFTITPSGFCQLTVYKEGHGIHSRLTILTGKYSYVLIIAEPTRQEQQQRSRSSSSARSGPTQ